MSFTALLPAVQSALTTYGNLTANTQVQIRLTPNPAAFAGMLRYVVIHPTEVTLGPSVDQNHGTDEYFSIGITVTAQTAHLAEDQIFHRGIIEDVYGLETLLRRIFQVMFTRRFYIKDQANILLQNPIHRVALGKEFDPDNPPLGYSTYYETPSDGPYEGPTSLYYVGSDLTTPPQFIEPLRYSRQTPFQPVTGGWFVNSEFQQTDHPVAVFSTLHYVEARRMQSGFSSTGVF